jgi:N-glycosylase/DNA lyase
MKKLPSYPVQEFEELKCIYALRRDAIRSRLAEFAAVPSSEYFYELVYCLLTPQSKARHADYAVEQLRASEFYDHNIDPEPFLRRKESYIRFHKTKARHLLRLKEQFPDIAEQLSKPIEAIELREWLVKNVLGLGLKESVHFLRNIGKNQGLAILDRHILRSLKRLNVIKNIPESLSRKRYLSLEMGFAKFADDIGIPLDELDLLFWSMATGEIRK